MGSGRHGQDTFTGFTLNTPSLLGFFSIVPNMNAQNMFIFEFITNVRRKTMVCLTQQSLFPTVNSAPVSDYISSVPITS